MGNNAVPIDMILVSITVDLMVQDHEPLVTLTGDSLLALLPRVMGRMVVGGASTGTHQPLVLVSSTVNYSSVENAACPVSRICHTLLYTEPQDTQYAVFNRSEIRCIQCYLLSQFCDLVKPVGGRWREGGSGWKEQRWQALPEWATDESTSDGGGKEKGKENRTGSAVGSFDTSGNFTMSEVSECFC